MSPGKVYVGEEGEGHSMLMDRRQKRRGNQQWRESGARNLEAVSIRSRERGAYGKECKTEDSHRGKTEQCA